ncbi:MAG: hypothetical protein ACR2PC_07910 [Tsuneonella suprasediminis]
MGQLDYFLYRAAGGRYEFRGAARLLRDPRFGPFEHHLLETHEHSHWALTQASIYGLAQLAVAYAHCLARNPRQCERYSAALEIMSRMARKTYEGCALFNERAVVRKAGIGVHPDWFGGLAPDPYGEGLALFDRFLEKLTFPPFFLPTIANNAAELALNSTPRFLWGSSRIDPGEIETALNVRSPDQVLGLLADCFEANNGLLADLIESEVIRPAAKRAGVGRERFFAPVVQNQLDREAIGLMSFDSYVMLRNLALSNGLDVLPIDPTGVDLVRYDIWLTWVRSLPGHQRMYPNLVRDIATMPLNHQPDPDDERYDFATFQTTFEPHLPSPSEDVSLENWAPIERSLAAFNDDRQHLYISLDDDPQLQGIMEVLEGVPLTGFMNQHPTYEFGSSLSVDMSMEEGVDRFREETFDRPPTEQVLRIGRAILQSTEPITWRHLGARYRLDQAKAGPPPPSILSTHKVLAIRKRNFDFATINPVNLPFPDHGGTIGILLTDSSAYGWIRTLREAVGEGHSILLQSLDGGVRGEFLILLGFLRTAPSPTFLYGLVSEHAFMRLQSLVLKDEGLKAAISSTGDLGEIRLDATQWADILLICSHLIERGF